MRHEPTAKARERVRALVAAAGRIADAGDTLGQEARRLLVQSTGLSPQGVELALSCSLEVAPSDTELEQLCGSVPSAPAVHVLLSANVFVAAHRAIALGLAASERVFVRSSRREPHMARLLARGAPQLFEIEDELALQPGEHLHAYGGDETLATIGRTLPDGVVLHGHGAGFGLALVEHGRADPERVAQALALDIALFDQQGCLSPRALLVVAGPAEPYARALALALERLDAEVPPGLLEPSEAAAVSQFRDAVTYAGELLPAGRGFVGYGDARGLVIAPVGRNCYVASCSEPLPLLAPHAAALTNLGLDVGKELEQRLASALSGCRLAALGRMQMPPFDGPVDRRASP